MTWIIPPHVTERENAHISPGGQYDGSADEDCVWCSGLMQYLGALPGAAPATHEEAERLRFAAGLGPSGPSNSLDLVRGTKARYGFEPTIIASGIASLKQFLVPGKSATVSGKLSNFPKGHRLRRFYPYFTGGHRVLVLNLGDYLWWLDPGGKSGYTGEKVTWAELATFVKGGVSHTLAPLATEDEMIVVTDTAPKQVTIAAGAVFYDPSSGAKRDTANSPLVRNSPYGVTIGGAPARIMPVGNPFVLVAVKGSDPKVSIAAPPDIAAKARAQGIEDAAKAAAAVK